MYAHIYILHEGRKRNRFLPLLTLSLPSFVFVPHLFHLTPLLPGPCYTYITLSTLVHSYRDTALSTHRYAMCACGRVDTGWFARRKLYIYVCEKKKKKRQHQKKVAREEDERGVAGWLVTPEEIRRSEGISHRGPSLPPLPSHLYLSFCLIFMIRFF